jgi:mono/diheme cytochrome c family protein
MQNVLASCPTSSDQYKDMLIIKTCTHKPSEYLPGSRMARRSLILLMATGLMLAALAPARAFTAEQVDKGREYFRLQCARCHGPSGQGITDIYRGMTAPPLIGPTAFPVEPRPYQKMRHFQFHTVQDIYEFASAVMPADQPASLSAEDYWDVISYLLNANGMSANGQPLDQKVAMSASLAKLQARSQKPGAAANLLPAPVGNTPVIEGQSNPEGQGNTAR